MTAIRYLRRQSTVRYSRSSVGPASGVLIRGPARRESINHPIHRPGASSTEIG